MLLLSRTCGADNGKRPQHNNKRRGEERGGKERKEVEVK